MRIEVDVFVSESHTAMWFIRTFFVVAAVGGRFVSGADYPFDVTTISAPDGSVKANFVSFGATLTELWVKDKLGKARDVILGYDDNSRLATDPDHPVFNPIVGRYANRIKGGTFSIPITKDAQPDGPGVYHIPINNGPNTLHGGILGWDRRNWTIVSKSPTTVTYQHIDDADEGFPGNVTVFATHTVSNGGTLNTVLHATASELTPIMLTQHIYWNLDAFQDGTDTILEHQLQIDGSKVIAVDNTSIPTGELYDVTAPATNVFDFKTAKPIGWDWNATVGLCNAPCQGYDHAWIYDHPEDTRIGTSLWSNKSGIRVDISTNQPAVQVYTAYWVNTPRKLVHGGPSKNYTSWSAVAIEQEGWLDAINTPEFGVDQIYGPGRDYKWSSTYKFSIQK